MLMPSAIHIGSTTLARVFHWTFLESVVARIQGNTGHVDKFKDFEFEFSKELSEFRTSGLESEKELKDAFEMIEEHFHKLGVDYVDSWLSSILVGTWTAFETMAAELWEKAVNAHPKGLAKLLGVPPTRETHISNKAKKRYGQKEHDHAGPEGEQSHKVIKLQNLIDYDFNISNVMGTVYRRSERFKFSRLDGTRDAYVRAFYEDYAEIRRCVLHNSISALAAVRHVLIHKAGIADSEFMNQADTLPQLSQFKKGETLFLTGSIVKELVHPAFVVMVELIYAVDMWLSNHKDKK